MAEHLVSDALWALIASLLPERPPRPKGGRPPLDDRKALEGIVFVIGTYDSTPFRSQARSDFRKRTDRLVEGTFETHLRTDDLRLKHASGILGSADNTQQVLLNHARRMAVVRFIRFAADPAAPHWSGERSIQALS
jgi:transposase